MAQREQRPWSNDEKNTLLAEIIKAQSPHPSVLWNVVANLGREPPWEEIPLPPGRSLVACRFAFDELRRTQPPSLVPFTLGPQTPLSAPPIATLKRPFHLEGSYSTGREIRPKPSTTIGGFAKPSPGEPPPKRKRGRPTKASLQARVAVETAGQAEPGPAPPPPARPATPTTAILSAGPPPGITASAEEVKPPPLGVTRMPISAVLTPTAPKSASSSSSSGKRRRARSTRSELEEASLGGASSARQEYESPYGRPVPGPEDTPARTAVLRHREEQTTHPQQPTGSQTQEPKDGTPQQSRRTI